MRSKVPVNSPLLPFRKKRYKDLKDALRHAIYSRPGGKTAETLAMESGLDRLSDLSRYVGDNPDDQRGRFLDIFIPLLVAMGDKGVDVYEFIGEEIRAAQERTKEDEIAEAARLVNHHLPVLPDLIKAIQTMNRVKK